MKSKKNTYTQYSIYKHERDIHRQFQSDRRIMSLHLYFPSFIPVCDHRQCYLQNLDVHVCVTRFVWRTERVRAGGRPAPPRNSGEYQAAKVLHGIQRSPQTATYPYRNRRSLTLRPPVLFPIVELQQPVQPTASTWRHGHRLQIYIQLLLRHRRVFVPTYSMYTEWRLLVREELGRRLNKKQRNEQSDRLVCTYVCTLHI